MNKNIAIEFDNVGKLYRLGLVGTGSLQHDINRWWQTSVLRKEDPYLKIGEVNDRSSKGTSDYVWALKDISFKVEQGDVVGIIGKNGAGKSTLLKLLSHITAPSTGHISYRGRIASLLEVGTGFHPEMTARQNIYMNGSIMGMTKQEITRKLDEIVDFAGIERYLDTPVKRFSSGMTVRLGFAVAAFLEPEILVVDEVLAVGDAEFQKKAIGKMQDVAKGDGRTVLFVSHNMSAVRSLCNNGIVLKNGQINYMGTADESVTHYLNDMATNNEVSVKDRTNRGGNGSYRVKDFSINKLSENYVLNDDTTLCFELQLMINKKIVHPRIGISVYTMQDQCVLWMDSASYGKIPSELHEDKVIKLEISKDFTLCEGKYFVNLACFEMNTILADHIEHAIEFQVSKGAFFSTGIYPLGKGFCNVKQNWEVL